MYYAIKNPAPLDHAIHHIAGEGGRRSRKSRTQVKCQGQSWERLRVKWAISRQFAGGCFQR